MRRRRSSIVYLIVIICCLALWALYGKKVKKASKSDMERKMPWNIGLYNNWHEGKSKVVTEPFQSYNEKIFSWYSDWNDRRREGRKIILLYTTWFSQQQWGGLTGHELYQRLDRCEVAKNCLLTYDKFWVKKASGVVFHGRDVEDNRNSYYSATHLRDIRNGVPSAQKWIFLSHENPWNDVNVYKPYDGLFNWTATFNRKSNIFIPYQRYVLRKKSHKILRNYAKEKTGLVAWAVSNCGSKIRLEYVRHLQRYVDVTVYGSCNCYFVKRRYCKHFNASCNKELSKFKFYLAFENDFCRDYVTEKYWERIQQDVVPVVMGSNYEGLAIPGSYIDVNHFGSIKELADYLLYLDRNDDAYNKYFAYKTAYEDGNEDFYCSICEKLNSEEAKQHSQVILSKEFNYINNCGINRGKSAKLQRQIKKALADDSASLSMYNNAKC